MDPTNDDSLLPTLLYVVPPALGVEFLLLLLGLHFGPVVLPLAGLVAGTTLRLVVVRVSAHRAALAHRQPARVGRPPLAWHRRVPTTGSVQGLREVVAALKRTGAATHQRVRHAYQAIRMWMPDAPFAQKLQEVVRTHRSIPDGPVDRTGAPGINAPAGGWDMGPLRQVGAAPASDTPNQ